MLELFMLFENQSLSIYKGRGDILEGTLKEEPNDDQAASNKADKKLVFLWSKAFLREWLFNAKVPTCCITWG